MREYQLNVFHDHEYHVHVTHHVRVHVQIRL
jgi:hypothetical protein